MKKLLVLFILIAGPAYAQSTGALCTSADGDFIGFKYGGMVAMCRRRVTPLMKRQVFAREGVPFTSKERARREVDHVIPLCAGGSNHIENLQLQFWDAAKRKDALESQLCSAIRRGVMSQQDGLKWFLEKLK